jgi:hypothetical protein
LEIDREIVLAEADGGPHGFDAAGGDAIEAGFSNLGDYTLTLSEGEKGLPVPADHGSLRP